MIRRWLARHRSRVVTTVSGVAVVAVVAGFAIGSNGYTAQRMDLGDGAVWVANALEQAVGRANPEVLELNAVVRADASELDIVQRGTDVLVVDRADAVMRVLDPATATLGDPIALPPEQTEVAIVRDRAVIHATGTGELWIVPLRGIREFDAASEPDLTFGPGSKLAASPEGALFVYWAEADAVVRIDPATGGTTARWPVALDDDDDDVALTAVGGAWALLDPSARVLVLERGAVPLGALAPAGLALALQEPGPAADAVLVATAEALLEVPVSGGDVAAVTGGRTGAPARPVVTEDCRFAAWNTGTAWRDCSGEGPVDLALDGMPGGARLVFAVNTRQVVLNDQRSGATWAVLDAAQLIDNWAELIVDELDEEVQQNDPDLPPQVEEAQLPPVAVDDEFGARPGRATVLPVLLNDYDPNGDVLVIEQTSGVPEEVGRLDLVTRNQQLQLTLEPSARGVIAFSYSISDGRGGTASATVRVTVRGESENSPPQQVRSSRATVADGGRVTANVLGDWVDPDGDPFYLISASVAAPDRVSYKPDGVVVYTDAGEGGDLRAVTLTMTDGRATGSGSLAVTVERPGAVPLVVEPWVVLATAGQEVTVRPLQHVKGGTRQLRLNAVPARPGATIEPSFEAGTFTFVSDEVRTHYVDFTVTDGDRVATGVVRIEVAAPPDANTRPVTVPKTVFVTTLSSETIDPTVTDIDPGGGVLVVTGLTGLGGVTALRAEVLDQRQVRVRLMEPLEGRSLTFGYRISNGLADAEGTITVVEIPAPAQLQPPIANDDAATVRAGDVVDIPVLANDEHPEGRPISLEPELAQPLPDGAGLLFVSGDRLRYLAPEVAGNYVAIYSVSGPDGQTSQARVSISVREENAATNNPPVPQRVTARVLAGETVRIQVPLAGIDPDGDSVQLIGATSNPEKGSVLQTGPGWIEYRAGDYSTGTDTFRYSVVDALGARAEGTIRVGISPRLDGARNPVANEDAVTVRPDRTVTVRVLANDSDPDGSPLRVISAEPNSPATTVEIVDDELLRITPPPGPGSYGVVYTIQNQYGGTSSNFVTVAVDPDAPLAAPIAQDVVLSVSDVIDRDEVDVDVLDAAFFAEGDPADLGVSLLPGYADGAELLADKRIRVEIGDQSRIIPFVLSHPEDAAIRAYAFVWVPGYDDALPQLDRTAPPLRVPSEQTIEIELNDYVVALDGSPIRLTDASTVRATHSNGDDLVVDHDTLVFTSADQYFGPASITFEVTDGDSADDPDGRRAILTLAIEVTPRENQPPVFVGGVVSFEPGQEKELDLVRLTNYPYDDIDELAYTVLEEPEGFGYELNGQRLVLRAHESTPKGTSSRIVLGVADDLNTGQAGRITLQVVPSTRPLAKPVPDAAVTPRGVTTVIDVLANDEANNPFPGTPLQVVAIRGLDGAELPDGVAVEPSADRSRLTVTVAPTALPIDTNLQYQVADATLDPDRYVWGTITISVQDVPDPVANVRVTEFGDRQLKLSWTPGQFNNSPITEYRVTMTGASGGVLISVTSCTTAVDCLLTTPGNGPGHAVRLSVTAVNGIGESEPAALAGQIWSDVIPPPPTALGWAPLDHGIKLTWKKPADTGGSPIEQYVVNVGGIVQVIGVDPSDPVGTTYTTNVQSPSLANGTAVPFAVSARNSAPNSLATWNAATGSGIPAGPPLVTGTPPVASGSLTDGATASVSWAGVFNPNGKAIERYWAVITTGAVPSCPPGGSAVQTDGATTSANFGGLTADVTYTITVYAWNGQGCTTGPSVQVTPRALPPTVTEAALSGPVADGEGTWNFRISGVGTGGGIDPAYAYMYRLVGDGVDGTASGVLSGTGSLVAGATHYGVPLAVELRACRSYAESPTPLCSANWSAPIPLGGVAVHNSPPGNLVFDPGVLGAGTWTWTSIPAAPGYEGVFYRCDNGNSPGGWTAMPENGSCAAGLFSGGLRVRVVANGGVNYDRSYSPSDYD